ncbi:MAG: VCBS repeat-containing protein [Planctomycetota bacterium]
MPTLALIFLLFPDGALEAERETERFANRLLTFEKAWERGDEEALAAEFAARVRTTVLPSKLAMAPEFAPVVHGALPVETLAARDAARMLIRFARAHGAVEHVSVQPKGENKAKIEIVGSVAWTTGVVTLSRSLDRFQCGAVHTLRRRRTIFREVGLPGTDPAVLDHPTLGLAAYGAAAADVNGDGRIDVLATGHDGNVLFLGGTKPVPVATPRQATAPLFLDFDNDGDPDLFCSANGKQMLLENRGGTFVDISEKAGVAVPSIGFTATAGDVNGDRVPDIYVACYHNYGPVAPTSWDDANNGLPNLLFVSNGDGTYREAAKEFGVAGARWSYAAQFCDVNGDGKLDLYVANDFGAGNNLYLREGDRFVDRAKEWGVWDGGYGMGVDFGDVDNDGKLDLYVTKMSSTAGNRLLDRTGEIGRLRFLAAGNSLYRMAHGKFVLDATPFPAGWAWGGGFLDIDNDGFEDLFAPNGHMSGASEKDT